LQEVLDVGGVAFRLLQKRLGLVLGGQEDDHLQHVEYGVEGVVELGGLERLAAVLLVLIFDKNLKRIQEKKSVMDVIW
jgi:hypothetical protein